MFQFIKKNKIYLGLLIIASAIILFVNSPFSPIRDINYLDYDSTIFYIIGKGIKYNYIPYIDLTDHKGIYIFLLNYLGAMICEKHNIGIFIVQFLVYFLSAISIYSLSIFITKDRGVSFLSTVTMLVLQNSYYFSQGGLKCETFLLPFMFFTLYLFLKEDWKDTKFSKSMFLIGIFAGIVMMTKANMLLCFIPIIIYHIYYLFIDKNIKRIFVLFISGMAGIICGVAPAIIYCIANNNLNEMFFYTFKVNFTYLNDLQYYFSSYFDAAVRLFSDFNVVIFVSILSVITFYKLFKRKNLLVFYIPYVVSSLVATLMAFRPYGYYASVLLPCIYFVVIYLYFQLKKLLVDKNKYLKLIYIFILVILCTISYRTSWKETERQQRVLYVVSRRLHKLYSDATINDAATDDKSLLEVGACVNIYNELNIFPNVKHFCTPNISKKLFSEPYDEIFENLSNRKSRFVALFFTRQMIKDGFNEDVREVLKDGYTMIGDVPGFNAELYMRN